jgi:hypothetical protein
MTISWLDHGYGITDTHLNSRLQKVGYLGQGNEITDMCCIVAQDRWIEDAHELDLLTSPGRGRPYT